MMNSTISRRVHIDTDSRRIKEMRAGLIIIILFCGSFWSCVGYLVVR